MVYKKLISSSQEEAPSNRRSKSKEMTIADHKHHPTTHCKGGRSSRRVGIQPKQRIKRSFEEPSFASSSSSSSRSTNDSIEENRDDEKSSVRQRLEDSRERERRSSTETNATQKLNKLEEFVLDDSGILQQDESIRMKKASLNFNASESSIDLLSRNDVELLDRADEQQPEKKLTSAASLERDAANMQLSDKKPNLNENVNLYSIQNSHQPQPISEQDYVDVQIDGQPSVESQCSITEKWERLLDGEGYTPPEVQPYLAHRPSDDLLHLLDSVTKSPAVTKLPSNEDSERSFKPLVLLAEKTIAVESSSQPETINPDKDVRHLNDVEEVTHRACDHGDTRAMPPSEASLLGGVHSAIATFYELFDKLFTCTVADQLKGSDSLNTAESRSNTARLIKSKIKKSIKKNRKRVRFDDEAKRLPSETPACERILCMCY